MTIRNHQFSPRAAVDMVRASKGGSKLRVEETHLRTARETVSAGVQFPVQKARIVREVAKNKYGETTSRLTLKEFGTSEPPDETDPTVVRCGQLPGCLPAGYSLDSLLTREEFCIWRRVSLEWLKPRVRILPGVVMESQKVFKIHPRSYLDKTVKGK